MSIFAILKPDEVEILNKDSRCITFRKGQLVFKEGSFPTGIYIINHGKVKVSRFGSDGKEQIVRLAREGEILGYRSLISGEICQASATCLENSSICVIGKETLYRLFRMNELLTRKFMELLARDLRTAEDKITILAQNSVRERLAQSLLMLRGTYGLESDGKTIGIILSREEIANIVGTATETVIRLLSDFKKDGLIGFSGKTIQLLRPEELVRISNVAV